MVGEYVVNPYEVSGMMPEMEGRKDRLRRMLVTLIEDLRNTAQSDESLPREITSSVYKRVKSFQENSRSLDLPQSTITMMAEIYGIVNTEMLTGEPPIYSLVVTINSIIEKLEDEVLKNYDFGKMH